MMNVEIAHKIKEGIEKNHSISHIKHELLDHGYLEKDIEIAMQKFSGIFSRQKPNSTRFVVKEIFDRIGYGFGSPLFLNIFFYLIGGSMFLIGIMNGLKAIFGGAISQIIDEYSKHKSIHKKAVGLSGVVFGMSFLLMSYGLYRGSLTLFTLGFLISSISVVPYGDMYQRMFKSWMIENKKRHIIGRLSIVGIFITSLTVFISAYILDKYGFFGKMVVFTVFDKIVQLKIYGYLIVLNSAAISIIIAGYIFYFIYWKRGEESVHVNFKHEATVFFTEVKDFIKKNANNKIVLILMFTAIILSIVQIVGNSYYSIFIFSKLNTTGFGGWMNIAVIFIIATLSTMMAPYITRRSSYEYGKIPMLAFGAALTAIMPLSFYYKPTLTTVSIGTICGIIGASINGVAATLIVRDSLKQDDMKSFFKANNFLALIPYIVLIPIGAFIAQKFGFQILFLCLFLAILVLVLPCYMIILIENHKKKKV